MQTCKAWSKLVRIKGRQRDSSFWLVIFLWNVQITHGNVGSGTTPIQGRHDMLANTWYKEASRLFLSVPTARFSPCWVKAFILPVKDFASLPNRRFRSRTLMWAASSRAKWKADGWGVGGEAGGGHNGPSLLPHPCRSYSKWPHWCCCIALCRGAPAEPKPETRTQRSLDTCQQTGEIDWDLASSYCV